MAYVFSILNSVHAHESGVVVFARGAFQAGLSENYFHSSGLFVLARAKESCDKQFNEARRYKNE